MRIPVCASLVLLALAACSQQSKSTKGSELRVHVGAQEVPTNGEEADIQVIKPTAISEPLGYRVEVSSHVSAGGGSVQYVVVVLSTVNLSDHLRIPVRDLPRPVLRGKLSVHQIDEVAFSQLAAKTERPEYIDPGEAVVYTYPFQATPGRYSLALQHTDWKSGQRVAGSEFYIDLGQVGPAPKREE